MSTSGVDGLFDSVPLEGGVEPVIKQGGSAEISDDEISALEAGPSIPQKKEAITEELKTKNKPKDENKKEASENERPEHLNDKKPALKDTAKEVTDAEKVKTFKIKQGDSEIDLRDDTTIPVPVGGKIENVSLKDLRAEYAGRTDWTRKYQELHNERKSFKMEQESIQTKLDRLHELSETDPMLAIEYLFEAMGADPEKAMEDLMGKINGKRQELEKLSPEERRARELEERLDHYKKKETLRRTEQEQAKQKEVLISRVHAVQDKFQISKEKFKACWDDLVAEAAKTGFDINNITPEMVGEYYQVINRKDTISSFATETYGTDTRLETITSQLYDVWTKNPELSIDDIKEIALQAFPQATKKASKLAARVKEEAKEKKVLPQHEPMSWDDL